MQRAIFVDLETSGLDPIRNQILELAMVKIEGTTVLMDEALHFYIEWPYVTYDTKALDMFGDRRRDRKPHVPVVNVLEAESRIRRFMGIGTHPDGTKWTMGGKNYAGFDAQFLKFNFSGFDTLVKHRCIDIGNKYDDPLDDALPDLETCRKRALRCGVSGQVIHQEVAHTALEDAALCAELYVGWQRGLVDYRKWR